jgi:hypothetical protein
MMITLIRTRQYFSIILFNLLATLIIVFTPTISHLTGFPFYKFEPMRLIIIGYILWNKNYNAYFLAITLPLFSFLLAGHPVIHKMPLVAIDLFLNVAFINFFLSRKFNIYFTIGLSVILSKIVYYLLKYFFINLGLLDNRLIDTSIIYQVVNVLILLIVTFAFATRKERFQEN